MNDLDRLSLDFANRHPDSFARVLGRHDFAECEQVISSLPQSSTAAIVARLPADYIRRLLDSGRHQPAEWLAAAPFGEAVNFLSRMARGRRLALVNALPDSKRRRQLLRQQQYPAHSVGALVSDIPVLLAADGLVSAVVNDLRALDPETMRPVVVVDADARYLGILNTWRMLLRNPPAGLVRDFILPVTPVRPETPVSMAASNAAWHARNWLPVVDHRERVLGVVSREKVFDSVGEQSGAPGNGTDILPTLLDDLVFVCEAALVKLFSERRAG